MPIVYGIAEVINSFSGSHTGSGVCHKTLANALKAVLGGQKSYITINARIQSTQGSEGVLGGIFHVYEISMVLRCQKLRRDVTRQSPSAYVLLILYT